ncbi:hypothetical protein C5S53_14385 [Methanophagales archaeon]|nr:hypothetical protein C5S53_14385 [Methanophagales archaeon]
MTSAERWGSRGGKPNLVQKHKLSIIKTDSLALVYAIIVALLIFIPSVSASNEIEMTHRVQVMDHGDIIVVYVTTSQMSEITLERFEPVKVAYENIRFSKANYNVMGLNCVVGRHATFRLQPISRDKDVVIPITLKSGNQSRAFTYTILAEEAVPTTPAVAIPPPATESEPTSQPDNSDLLMVVLGATGVLGVAIIGNSIFQIKRPNSREK